jgi:hypothetical protein
LFRSQHYAQTGNARELPTRSVQARDEPDLDRVRCQIKDNRGRRGRSFGGKRPGSAPGDDHGRMMPNQFSRQCRQPIVLPLRKAIFDQNVAAFDETRFAQAPTKRVYANCV